MPHCLKSHRNTQHYLLPDYLVTQSLLHSADYSAGPNIILIFIMFIPIVVLFQMKIKERKRKKKEAEEKGDEVGS